MNQGMPIGVTSADELFDLIAGDEIEPLDADDVEGAIASLATTGEVIAAARRGAELYLVVRVAAVEVVDIDDPYWEVGGCD